ncbi:ciliary microtubule inner protein 2B-like isoform X2 [Hetaerina americana]|uniref:ciliary microtubule inner protein 2B-like isoform X2 n=1 Tax=Hetaerina americana TaxID=62018 RepID=UPI003A7F5CB8
MFVGLTAPERGTFLTQTSGCFIPGYTGHCPTLKFRFGKRYGANTKEIIQQQQHHGHQLPQPTVQQQHHGPTTHQPVMVHRASQVNAGRPPETSSHRDHNGATVDHTDPYRSRRFILGYTGYIPGLNFRYGKSFERAADDSVAEFGRRLREQNDRREKERNQRARSAPKTFSSRPREQVRASMREYEEKNRYKACSISPEFPPIAGYTGHIPRLTDASLSQRYNAAARRGLMLLQEDRERWRLLEKRQ